MRFDVSGDTLQPPRCKSCLEYWGLKQKKVNSKYVYYEFGKERQFLSCNAEVKRRGGGGKIINKKYFGQLYKIRKL
jgi:hypothetical protein